MAGSLKQARHPVAANAVALFLAYVLPRSCTFAAGIVAARVLGLEGFGAYGTAAALAVMASIIATLGMQPLLVREITREPGSAPALIGAAHGVKLVTIGMMSAALIALATIGALPHRVFAASLLLGAAYGVGALVENLSAYFQAVERMYIWTQASSLYGLVSGGLGILLMALTRDLLAFCVAPLVGQLAALAWLLARAPAAVRRPLPPSRYAARRLLRQLAPFAVAFIATTVYYRGDVLLLAHLRSQADVGTYMAARRFLDVAQALAMAAAGAAYPRLSRGGTGRERSTRIGLDIALLACVPAAALLFLLREPLVHVLYGADYAGAVPVLALLAPALAPLALNMFCLAALSAADDAGTAARLWLGAVVVNLGLNALLIPRHGAAGAAAASLASETLLAVGFLAVQARRGARPSASASLATAGAGALALAAGLAAGVLGPATPLVYSAAVAWLYHHERVLPRAGRHSLRARAPEVA